MKSAEPTHTHTAPCPSCRTEQRRFYCHTCLSDRIRLHRDDAARISAARAKATMRVEALLGSEEDTRTPWTDAGRGTKLRLLRVGPTESPTSPNSPSGEAGSVAHVTRRMRSRMTTLSDSISASAAATDDLHARNSAMQSKVQERREALMRRRATLHRAHEIILGPCAGGDGPASDDDGAAGILRGKGAWKNLLRPRSVPAKSASDARGLSSLMAQRKAEVADLERACETMGRELMRTRAILAQEAFRIFAISPPAGTIATSEARNFRSDLHAPTQPAKRPKSKERQSSDHSRSPRLTDFKSRVLDVVERHHAFQRERSSKAWNTNVAVAPGDWSIGGLVLPLPSDLKRFARDHINGAVSHTVHLLQLLTSLLGLQLPFSLQTAGGLLSIHANPLWPGDPTLKEELHLTSTAHQHIVSTSSAAPSSGIGASAMQLGASTLSTLESFVHLPSGHHFSWGLSSVLHPNQATGGAAEAVPPSPASKDGAPAHGGRGNAEPGAAAARAFRHALVMLSYDVAYLAHIAGVKIDLVSAAGSPLRLLSRAMHGEGLGRRAHANWIASDRVQDLSFPGLDYLKLLQVHDSATAGGAANVAIPPVATSAGASTRHASSSKKRRESQAKARPAPSTTLEESYVDAAVGAASILNKKPAASSPSPGPPRRVGSTAVDRSASAATASGRPSHAATLRVPSTGADPHVAPASLDFLRTARRGGEREAKERRAPRGSHQTPLHAPGGGAEGAGGEVGISKTASRGGKAGTPDRTGGGVIFNGAEVVGTAFDDKLRSAAVAGGRAASAAAAAAAAAPAVTSEASKRHSLVRASRKAATPTTKTAIDEGWDVI